mmetsp:Transcript_16997/g.31838  ORF Transcript_16997/g.31838 Transcript_16997/m.31838 type:complete len:840 (-) Transcript_16997:141-2660(-)
MVLQATESAPPEALLGSLGLSLGQACHKQGQVFDLEKLLHSAGEDALRKHCAEALGHEESAAMADVAFATPLNSTTVEELTQTCAVVAGGATIDALSEASSDAASEAVRESTQDIDGCKLDGPVAAAVASSAECKPLSTLPSNGAAAIDEPRTAAVAKPADLEVLSAMPADSAADAVLLEAPLPSLDAQTDTALVGSPSALVAAPSAKLSSSHTAVRATAAPPDVARSEEKGPKKRAMFNASHCMYDVVTTAAEDRGWRVVRQEERANQCNVHWIDNSCIAEWLPRVEPWMRINHFPGMNNALARKSRLARNISRMQRLFPKEYQFIPPTWVLPDDVGDLEKRFDSSGESKAIYIVKPDHLCQGKGIFLTTNVERIRQCAAFGREKDTAIVVQRYITRPMLIEGLKFDLRLYFLVGGRLTEGGGLDPRYFLFRDGLVRLCTTPYEPPTPDTFDKRCMHLTNYAVNKNSKNFQQAEGCDDGTGSKRSLSWFLRHVEAEFGEKEREKLWKKLMGLCTKTLITVHSTLEAEYFGTFPKDLSGGQMDCRCFEVLGVDVMLDAKRKPYLIEVNHLPSFTCDSPLDEDIKKRLVEQTLDLTCGTTSGKDKRLYEQLVRERREAGGQAATRESLAKEAAAASGHAEAAAIASSPISEAKPSTLPLDLPFYKDFERAYPPPDGSTKLAAQCEAILARVREVFRPVQTRRRPTRADDDSEQPQAPQRPPLPPRPPGAVSGPPPGNSGGSLRSRSSAAPSSPRSAADSDKSERRRTSPSKKRSRSAPGPPRCALPSISRFSSPRLLRGQSSSPALGEGGAENTAPARPERRSSSRQRVFLPLKSAQILL